MKASPIRCLISAGPTREFFDPVRFVSNPSSGKMGFALAKAAQAIGWEVELVSGPVSLEDPVGVDVERVVTGAEMYEAISARFDQCDILIMTAAIMDYKPKKIADQKVKKYQLEMIIEMEPVIDILATVSERKDKQLIVGFAAETNNLEAYALRKLEGKKADYIIANQIGMEGKGFQSDDNEVTIYGLNGFAQKLERASKESIANDLIALFKTRLGS